MKADHFFQASVYLALKKRAYELVASGRTIYVLLLSYWLSEEFIIQRGRSVFVCVVRGLERGQRGGHELNHKDYKG